MSLMVHKLTHMKNLYFCPYLGGRKYIVDKQKAQSENTVLQHFN